MFELTKEENVMCWIFLMFMLLFTPAQALHRDFVYLEDIAPNIIQDLRYFSSFNFIGRPIKGYYVNKCILTRVAANSLVIVQKSLQKKGFGLVVYDCYRPQKAVTDFYQWSQNIEKKMKKFFYPRESKKTLFKRGYIAKYSGHSRGSTVDLSIYNNSTSKGHTDLCYAKSRSLYKSIDMGTNFDCLDPKSYWHSKSISKKATLNRKILKDAMLKQGFKPYSKEWWHFSLRKEPYPKTYFNFDVK